jgi:membrane-associated phospholipid phosphatase
MRQIVQAFSALPQPPNMIWHYPGFPSLLVTYSVAGDFFFSGHTAIAVFAATEIARLKKRWLTALAIFIVLFEIAAVIVLRAHYTMDVFAGAIAALWVASFVGKAAAPIDRFVETREQRSSQATF